ncbi:PIN domain-like protein, partial [Periconia macrospinosa]
MGIASIWKDLEKHVQVEELARIAIDHYDAHKRPFRIAVDVAGWIFNNVTKEQVVHFRQISQDAARTDAKNIYCHITVLLALNIELLVVFDGKTRAPKKSRGFNGHGCPMRHERNRDLLRMLDTLNVPYYEAPGEAEAECAMLQMKGHVDAVWSEDSDTLMFGCSLLLRFHKDESSRKQWHKAEILRSIDIQNGLGFDRAALVLFAMLVGGDYGNGLLHCGPALAKQLIPQGLGGSLIECKNRFDCKLWREDLVETVAKLPNPRKLSVPVDYPSYDVLKKYVRPKVSSDGDLAVLPFIETRPPHIFDEKKLFPLSMDYLNQFGKLYMEHVTPVFLTRWLLKLASDGSNDNVHAVEVPKRRSKDNGIEAVSSFIKIKFSPFGLTSLPESIYANKWQKMQPYKTD